MRREVVFQSGRELNKTSTNYFSYPALGRYALVSNSPVDIAIIEITAALVPDSDGFSNENFKRLFSVRSEVEAEQVNTNEKGRKWKIIAKEGVPARFIDPRVEGDANGLNRPGQAPFRMIAAACQSGFEPVTSPPMPATQQELLCGPPGRRIRDLRRATRADGVFCYTFFKGVRVLGPTAGRI